MGLFQFQRMPFRLAGAPRSLQWLMDNIFRGLPFVTTYIDVLVHLPDEETHKHHLHQVFQRLQDAGLTLHGRKRHIRMDEVSYLGHIFSGSGMSPDQQIVKAIQDWPQPTDATTVLHFLGLASYYRRYIHSFTDFTSPLHNLTQ